MEMPVSAARYNLLVHMLGQDMIWYICDYISIMEIGHFGLACTNLHNTVNDNNHWKCLVERRLFDFRDKKTANQLYHALGVGPAYNLRRVFVALWPFCNSSLLGNFGLYYPIQTLEQFEGPECRGELLRVRLDQDSVVVTRRSTQEKFQLRCVDNGHKVRLELTSYGSNFINTLEPRIVHGQCMLLIAAASSVSELFFPLPTSDWATDIPAVTVVFGGVGSQRMFEGVYGPHGCEVVSMRLTHSRTHTTDESGGLLEGLKVTGDRNVPAGQISFRVSVAEEVDFQREVEGKLIQAFRSPDRQYTVSVQRRISRIAHCWRGEGTINRIAMQWAPEPLEILFVLYNPECAGYYCAERDKYFQFSVVFVHQSFGHMIDFSLCSE